MSKADAVSSVEIEAAINNAGDSFSLAGVAKALGHPRSDSLRQRLERAVERDDRFFYDHKFNCRTRQSFFTGREFLITPDEWELSEGVLFPGHRFVPFVPESVFPSDVVLNMQGVSAAKRKMVAPLGKIFHYHLLLGSEQIFDFLLAEDRANAHLARRASASDSVTLEVFDLAGFYRENDFKFGDAILCRVEDFEGGVVAMSYLPAEKRRHGGVKEHIEAMDSAMRVVWEDAGDYLDIPEQLARAEFIAGSSVVPPGASSDEFITGSKVVELRAEGDHAVLSIREQESENVCSCGHDHDHDHGNELPEGLTLSTNELDDPEKILAGAGMPLTMAEIEAFMLDAIYGRETDFDGVYSRIFGHRELDLKDDVQQAVLLNILEERFEELLENYNRVDDEPKAELRSGLLEAVSERLEFLAALGDRECDPGEREKKILHDLAEISTRLGELLKLLNNPAFTPDSAELEQLAAVIDTVLDRQDELISGE